MVDEFTGQILAEKYEIEELLHESEFGSTYRGTHLLMEKPVTVKILSPALAVDESIVERFSEEARTVSRLSHPNILNVTDFGKDGNGTVFLVMEDVEGGTLKETIEREGAFPVARAVRIARQIAAALSSAHASGIIHRGLTSDKIILMPMGTDSELVKVVGIGSFDAGDQVDYEEPEHFADLAYLSPEQCTREFEADERSDIYSLGIILYEMLTGEVPFTADTPTDLMLKHAQSPPPPLIAFRDDVPEEVEPILINALAKNPDKRYGSAAAFADALGEASGAGDEDETIVIPKTETADAAGNNLWKTAFIVLAGISVVAFGFIYWTSMKQTDPATIVQTDKDGKPVQPLNPATGQNEQNLPNMDQFPSGSITDMDPALLPPDLGGTGGDGGYSNPWDDSSNPPPGAPIGSGGDTIYLGPDDGSIFMPNPDGSGVILVPKPMPPKEEPPKGDEPKTDKPGTDKPDAPKQDKPADKPKPDAPAGDKPKNGTSPKKTNDGPKKESPPKPASGNANTRSGVEQDT